jgi:hypothetical protein
MLRQEAIALLKELGDRQLIQPFSVIIEKQTKDKFQLKIKGSYDLNQIESFLKKRGFTYENSKDYLIIFKQ